jgi:flagellar biosynthesis protein
MTNEAERPFSLSQKAVAIKGEDGRQARLLAKGQGAVASAIVDSAFANGVRVREDAALTQMLDAFDVDSAIPLPALDAVCAVLTHVYEQTQSWPADWRTIRSRT